MNTSGGIIEIIGLSLEFPSILYLLRDATASACTILENVPTVLRDGIANSNIGYNKAYMYSLFWLGVYFMTGVFLSKSGNWLQSENTIKKVEGMLYSKKAD
jgi:hypothetical protein